MRQNGGAAAKSRHPRHGGRTHGHTGESRESAGSGLSTLPRRAASAAVAVFLTDLGWFGLVGYDETVLALTIGHASPDAVRSAIAGIPLPGSAPGRPRRSLRIARRSGPERLSEPKLGEAARGIDPRELDPGDWNPGLRRRLEGFARGERCEFPDCRLGLPAVTPFQRRVIAETRRIGWGQTLTYGELAARAGAPRAARAVGSVMAANRVPIIVPCHRVIASGGRLGGYSAPQGLDLKRRLLALEAAAR